MAHIGQAQAASPYLIAQFLEEILITVISSDIHYDEFFRNYRKHGKLLLNKNVRVIQMHYYAMNTIQNTFGSRRLIVSQEVYWSTRQE